LLEAPLNIAGRAFRPAAWATALMLAGVALTIVLGFWQLGRAQTKQALQGRIDEFARQAPIILGAGEVRPDELALRRVEARGRFDARHAVFIDNRVYKHQPGFHVVMPLRLGQSDKYVLVNRGWIAAGAERTRAPVVNTPVQEVVVRGTAVPPSERFLELSSKVAEGNIWQNLVIERYRQATKLDVHPLIIQQTELAGAPDDGLIRDWPPVDLKRNTHLAYAVQWFALAAAIFIYYLAVNVRRKSA
jgi:surfeit locus 1 family protein